MNKSQLISETWLVKSCEKSYEREALLKRLGQQATSQTFQKKIGEGET